MIFLSAFLFRLICESVLYWCNVNWQIADCYKYFRLILCFNDHSIIRNNKTGVSNGRCRSLKIILFHILRNIYIILPLNKLLYQIFNMGSNLFININSPLFILNTVLKGMIRLKHYNCYPFIEYSKSQKSQIRDNRTYILAKAFCIRGNWKSRSSMKLPFIEYHRLVMV